MIARRPRSVRRWLASSVISASSWIKAAIRSGGSSSCRSWKRRAVAARPSKWVAAGTGRSDTPTGIVRAAIPGPRQRESVARARSGTMRARRPLEADMDDVQIHGTIEQLVAEEHELWERESSGDVTDQDRRRLEELKVSLDRCWDLLRQRRALREAGRDPEAAKTRSENVVERYLQ